MRAIGLALLGFVAPFSSALERAELIGAWRFESKGELEEGFKMEVDSVYEFIEDGTVRSNGVAIIFLKEEKQRVITFAGVDTGTWSLKEKQLKETTTKMNVHLFSSALEEMKRSDFMESLPELIGESTTYSFLSRKGEKLIFKDNDHGQTVTLTRIEKKDPKEGEEAVRKAKLEKRDREVRMISSKILEFDGFKFAKNLPTLIHRDGVAGKLRPTGEILDRLLCQYLAMAWVLTNEEQFPTGNFQPLIDAAGLKDHFLAEEMKILKTSRDNAGEEFSASIGWTMENMWALGWVLGLDLDLDIDDAQAGNELIKSLAIYFQPAWKDKKTFIKELKMRSEEEVIQMEDLFYCCHNAVRSAQTGRKDALPKRFNPISNGGVIHEKRHALTWVLSPKVKWDDTDLST